MRSLRYWERASGAYNSQIKKIVRLLHRAERQERDWTPRLATHRILVWLTAQTEVADSVKSDVRKELDRYSAQYARGSISHGHTAVRTALEHTGRIAQQLYAHLSAFCSDTYPRAIAGIMPAGFMQRFISPDYWTWICWAWTTVLLALLLRLAAGHPLLFYSPSAAQQQFSPSPYQQASVRPSPSPTRMSDTSSGGIIMLGPLVLFGDYPMTSGYDFFIHLLLFLGPFLLLRYLNRRLQYRR
ncbi:hypothetical protein FOZ61_004542 [Perkinsus olseni]|uniref:Uncharacterized protein n=1 Tax=Perkinsus olseni TaxID=32597 RepID=A0A7J6LK83_PEROL|nr:hypothetical protein FOZ61_004542 [Perkinsus olseni]